MTISGISSPNSLSFGQPIARPVPQPADGDDQVSMSLSADTFSSLVSEAGQMPEVRGEVVDAFKSRVQSGQYPPAQTLDGLADLIGSHWPKFAQAGGTSDTSASS